MQTLSAAQRRFFEQAATTYQADLAGDTSALAYLASRGFSPQAAAMSRLGVVRRPLPGHEYAGRLVLTYTTPAGVVNLRFRCIEDRHVKAPDGRYWHELGQPEQHEGCPKYLSQEGAGTNLYGVLDLKKDSPFICVTEGEIDRDTLSVLCDMPAVASPGVDAWQKHWGRCLEDYDRVYSFADPDKAGRKFAGFLAREVRAIPITIPGGMDVNRFYCKEGPDGPRALID
ncbi:toprim domain-containing protein [Streptomyces sp. NPDC002928]|uniref:toprim domain-containing protein n=1 Tax=Streptomyces sp. NPDC002928 TaxID=3154440 RepID=UPI0033BF0B4C